MPIEKVIRQPNKLYIHTSAPGAARRIVGAFPAPALPLQVPGMPATGNGCWRCRRPNGRHYVLDSELAWLDLTDEERSRLLAAARGS